MFTKSAKFYDALYTGLKDYRAEAEKVHLLIQQYQRTDGNRLLDVACGTGEHDLYLHQHYQITGLDLDAVLLDIARKKVSKAEYIQHDMRDFDLGEQFDAVICLFGSIAYLQTVEAMTQTLHNFYRHTKPGGVVVVEPFVTQEQLRPGHVALNTGESPDMKISRMGQLSLNGSLATLHFHFLVGTSEGISYFTEDHYLGVFKQSDYAEAMQNAGYQMHYDEQGLMGRGLYVGVRQK